MSLHFRNLFEYYGPKDELIREMTDAMENDEILTQKMYKYFICIR